MADFKIHKFQVTLTSADQEVTEGTAYTLDAGTTSADAFARITNTMPGCGVDRDSVAIGPDHICCYIEYDHTSGSDITAGFSLKRDDSTLGDLIVDIEVIECLNPTGDNGIKVLGTDVIQVTDTTTTGSSATMTTPTTDANVVCFHVGTSQGSTNQLDLSDTFCHLVWNGATDKIDLTRAKSTGLVNNSVVAVEFTGANWTIQNGNFTTSTAGSDTVGATITTVTDTANAFCNFQYEAATTGDNIDDIGCEIWLSSATQISYALESGAVTGGTVYWWVIENSGLNVQRANSTRSASGGVTFTYTTFTAVADLDQSGLGAITSRHAATGSSTSRNSMNARLTAVGTLSMETYDDQNALEYHVEIVEWPATAASGTIMGGLINTGLVRVVE